MCYRCFQVRPLLTEDEFKKTEEVVAEFGQKGGIGQQLHAKLAEMKEKTDAHTWDSNEFQTWLEEMWDALAYMRDRNPLPVNVNVFGTVFAGEKQFEDPIAASALIVRGASFFGRRVGEHGCGACRCSHTCVGCVVSRLVCMCAPDPRVVAYEEQD